MESALIVSDPEVMMGKPVVAGTRITVELILDALAASCCNNEMKFVAVDLKKPTNCEPICRS